MRDGVGWGEGGWGLDEVGCVGAWWGEGCLWVVAVSVSGKR